MKPIRTIEIVVEGEPIGQPRARSDPRTGRMYTPKVRSKIGTKPNGKPLWGPDKLEPWKRRVELACFGKVSAPIHAPMRVSIVAFFPRCEYHAKKRFPKGHVYQGLIPTTAFPYITTPDKDNVEKAILDAMKTAGMYTDDSLVFAGPCDKWYCSVGYDPGVRITIDVYPTVLVEEPAQLSLQEAKP